MKLIIMRHCKSAWDQPVEDHDRVLNARGQDAAERLGDWLRGGGHSADQALVSSAARTQQTYALLGFTVAAETYGDLYLASPQQILDRLNTSVHAGTVLVLGHNPGIAAFARMMLGTPPNHSRFDAFPTGATLVMDTDLRPGSGRCIAFAVPRDL